MPSSAEKPLSSCRVCTALREIEAVSPHSASRSCLAKRSSIQSVAAGIRLSNGSLLCIKLPQFCFGDTRASRALKSKPGEAHEE